MWRLIKIYFVSTGVVAITIGLLVAVAQHQPLPTTIQNLQLADCEMPCLLGIKINQTAVNVAEQHILKLFGDYLTTMPSTERNVLIWDKYSPSRPASTIKIDFEKNVVVSVEIVTGSFNTSMPTLGEILSTKGPPDCVWQYNRSSSILLIYQKGFDGNMMYVAVDALTLTEPISAITVTALGTITCTTEFTLPWRGLHSRTLYHAGD